MQWHKAASDGPLQERDRGHSADRLCSRGVSLYTTHTTHTVRVPLSIQEVAVSCKGLLCYDHQQSSGAVTEGSRYSLDGRMLLTWAVLLACSRVSSPSSLVIPYLHDCKTTFFFSNSTIQCWGVVLESKSNHVPLATARETRNQGCFEV